MAAVWHAMVTTFHNSTVARPCGVRCIGAVSETSVSGVVNAGVLCCSGVGSSGDKWCDVLAMAAEWHASVQSRTTVRLWGNFFLVLCVIFQRCGGER